MLVHRAFLYVTYLFFKVIGHVLARVRVPFMKWEFSILLVLVDLGPTDYGSVEFEGVPIVPTV